MLFNKSDIIYREINRLWWMFRIVYGIAFIGSGFDKFFNYLINWYLQGVPVFLLYMGVPQNLIFYLRGTFEVLIGIMLLFSKWTKNSAYAASLWLLLSALYVGLVPDHFDTAMRYAVIALGAYALARLTIVRENLQ